jgi:ribosomal protein S6E (S10)
MSKGLKTALIVIAVFVCLCAIGGGAALYFGGSFLSQAMVTNPADAAKVGQEIASYQKPEGYQEQIAMNFAGVKMVIMTKNDGANGFIMMMQAPAGAMTEADLKARMQQSFNQSFSRNNVSLSSVGSQDVTIKGQTVKMEILEGTNDKGVKMRQGIAVFNGTGGPTVLMLMSSEADWDPAQIDAFLASIK